MSRKKPKCVYCGVNVGDTRDHTPPKCFFGGKLPPNAISVPCCEPCRKAGQKNETTIRNLLISFESTEAHPLAQSSLLGKRDRSFAYDLTEVGKLMEMMVDVEVVSPGGIYVGTKKGFHLKHSLVDAFVERMSRALLYEEFGQPFFVGDFGWRLNPPIEARVMKWMQENLSGREVANVFYYRITNPPSVEPYWINMIFFERIHIMARVQKGERRIIETIRHSALRDSRSSA